MEHWIGDSGNRQQQGRQGTEAANGSKGVGMVVSGSSEGVGGRKWPAAARALASRTVGVWDSSRKPFICGSYGVWDGRINGDRKPLVLVLIGHHGHKRQGQKRGAWWWQQGSWL